MKSAKKYIIFIVLIILIFVGLSLYNSYNDIVDDRQELYKQSQQYNEELRNLRKEQDALNLELDDLYEELYTGGLGTTIIVLSDTHATCLDDAVTLLDKYGYKGVIALSYRYLPEDNRKGYLTRSQIDDLVDSGYELVIKATNEELEKTYERFDELGYDIKGFYFEDIAVNSLMVEQIHNIDENLVVIGNYLDGVGVTDTLLINYYGVRQQNVKTYYEQSVERSGVVALTVGYDKSVSRYEESNFANMLDFISDYVRVDETEVCNISGAIERDNIYLEKLSQVEPEKYGRLMEIKDRLNEISQEIMNMELQ